ncbi:isocitrate lyase/phosphoenolpyruvate mutase family protein [Streptomyces albofaciens JCM 4342]|uniref:isocitrate lyase/PEP mutase family protein n=1 Tax=Streptomyces albofaciens TaxID=66866 RepID=UPI001238F5BE|nr:isocitrate lyase/phosphoenolpyruvate mutase family protein [Streptomyces albofaciens]KAA6214413.1 isocitrate lyase/phosphoenolpyruvate mutase family protein [Streptomyces albofaciens JCM 4342]
MTAAALRALHHGRAADDPLVLPGPWDAESARIFAAAGFPALATPSAGVSAALGYADGGTPPDEMFAAVARIVRAVDVPVTADLEAGYGLPAKELVERIAATGAVGCNIEDSDHHSGALTDAGRQADRLAAIRAAAGDGLVLNARIDVFLPGRGGSGGVDGSGGTGGSGGTDDSGGAGLAAQVEEAVRRGLRYADAGADCVYPILAPPRVLRELADRIGLPVNAIAVPGGPSPRELGAAGASRVTFGGGLHRRAMGAVQALAEELRTG